MIYENITFAEIPIDIKFLHDAAKAGLADKYLTAYMVGFIMREDDLVNMDFLKNAEQVFLVYRERGRNHAAV